MKLRRIVIYSLPLLILIPYVNVQAQEEEKPFGISFSGFVKNDLFFDSRQTFSPREGHFMFWPQPEELDNANEDINDHFKFNMLAIQSRLSAKITGPDAFGAKTSGVLEGDFFAQSNVNINLFRLRHALVRLNWTNTELLAGQYWNPFFTTDCFPGTVSFNTGVPMQPFARNPQIRLTQKIGDLKIIAAALAQRDHASAAGPQSLSNAGIPDMHLQFHYNNKMSETNQVVAGVGAGYKQIVPSLVTTTGFKTDEAVSGLSFVGFFKLQTSAFTLKVKDTYGENIYDMLGISSYAITELSNDMYAYPTYAPTRNNSIWLDMQSNGSKFQAGLFGGYNKNLGAAEEIIPGTINGGARDVHKIDYILRLSPRAVFISGKTKIGAELEYTGAAFAEGSDAYDEKGAVTNSEYVANTRLLVSVIYSF